jgi:hypothetical protein
MVVARLDTPPNLNQFSFAGSQPALFERGLMRRLRDPLAFLRHEEHLVRDVVQQQVSEPGYPAGVALLIDK